MSNKKKNYNIIGEVNCDKCKEMCDLKEIIEPTEKQLKGAYYFKEWYVCKCGYYGRDEINKVCNTKEVENYLFFNGKKFILTLVDEDYRNKLNK